MTSTLKGLKALIKTKLEGLVESGTEVIFEDVFDYPNGDFKNYPVAVILNTGASGSFLDTARNERTFHFTINLYQENTDAGEDKETADEVMTETVDAVINSFDKDKDLGGEVEIIRVVEATFDFKITAGTFNFASIKVDCVVVVPNY
jgi:hypothetical protein